MSLYYEAHITIEPVFDDRLNLFKTICREHRFHVAELLMKKRSQDQAERSPFDTFCTARDAEYQTLATRTQLMVKYLLENGFKVWRYKIEDAICDSKIDDVFALLKS